MHIVPRPEKKGHLLLTLWEICDGQGRSWHTDQIEIVHLTLAGP